MRGRHDVPSIRVTKPESDDLPLQDLTVGSDKALPDYKNQDSTSHDALTHDLEEGTPSPEDALVPPPTYNTPRRASSEASNVRSKPSKNCCGASPCSGEVAGACASIVILLMLVYLMVFAFFMASKSAVKANEKSHAAWVTSCEAKGGYVEDFILHLDKGNMSLQAPPPAYNPPRADSGPAYASLPPNPTFPTPSLTRTHSTDLEASRPVEPIPPPPASTGPPIQTYEANNNTSPEIRPSSSNAWKPHRPWRQGSTTRHRILVIDVLVFLLCGAAFVGLLIYMISSPKEKRGQSGTWSFMGGKDVRFCADGRQAVG
ncbi:hypothetical protein Q7P37_005297 [Cladosporium fusiforme]